MHISVISAQAGIQTYPFHYHLKIKEKPSIWIPPYAGLTTVFCVAKAEKHPYCHFIMI